jgi:uncharacterized protein YbcI
MSLNTPSGSGPDAPPPALPGDLGMTAGDEVTDAISREIAQAYVRTFGRGPTRTRVFIQPQFAVCVLRGIFTSAERALIAKDDGDEVEFLRKRLNAGNDEDLQAIVVSQTGRPVQSHVSEVRVPADLAVHLFVFEGGRLSGSRRRDEPAGKLSDKPVARHEAGRRE